MAQSENDPFEVEDPDQLIQRYRIKAILEARSEVLDARRRAMNALANGRVGQEMAARIVKEAVDSYAIESEQKIKEHLPVKDWGVGIPASEINETDLETPSARIAYVTWLKAPFGKVEADEAGKALKIAGIQQYLNVPSVVTFSYETKEYHAIRGAETETHVVERPIPIDVSIKAYTQLNAFWSHMNMDVIIEESGLDVEEGFDSLSTDGATFGDTKPEL